MSDLESALKQHRPTKYELGKLADLIEKAGIDLAEVGKVNRIKAYQGFMRNAEDEPEVVDLFGIEFVPSWVDGPEYPVCQQAKPVIAKPRPMPKKERKHQTVVIVPDPQIGFRRYEDGSLEPFHDDAAMEIALQIIRDSKPDKIVMLGDAIDGTEWTSKFIVEPEFVLTTQPAIDRLHRFIAEQLTEAPAECSLHLLEGNHDARMSYAVTRNAMAALRLRQANAPESWPVLSMQHLLRMSEFGSTTAGEQRVSYHAGYPAGRMKIADGFGSVTPLFAIHGERLDVSKVAKHERQSFVQGHIHRIQDWSETYEINGEAIHVSAWSPGCLCRIDGAVPSARGASDSRGKPIHRIENWQQGVAVVTIMQDGTWSKESIPINNRTAIWRDQRYAS